MTEHTNSQPTSAVFITFAGNCKRALSLYQTLFGGTLQFRSFEGDLQGYGEMPVVSGSLIANGITIHGSDLVHNEGRKLGNYMSIFLHCKNAVDRRILLRKLIPDKPDALLKYDDEQNLIEVTDAFDVRWVLGI